MSTLLLTIVIAFFIVIVAIALLGVGWLITGKPKIQGGTCGRNPHQQQNKSCGTSVHCQLCDQPDKKEENQEKHGHLQQK